MKKETTEVQVAVGARNLPTLRTSNDRFKHLALLALAASALFATPNIQAGQRPIEDFLKNQGTYMAPGYETWPAWTFFFGWINFDTPYVFAMDYAGVASRWLGEQHNVSLGTTFEGIVIERALRDGTTEVEVILQTYNAVVWINPHMGKPDELVPVFGYNPDEIAAGRPATLGDCKLHAKFINHAPGGELPDLESPDAELLFLTLNGQAYGPLRAGFGVPEGTPGFASYVSPAAKLTVKAVREQASGGDF